jgi:hypothetical protein
MLAKGWGRVAETRAPRGYIVFAVEKKSRPHQLAG